MKKIIFHIHCLRMGGAERVVVNLAERFAADGYQVAIAIEASAEDEYVLSDKVTRKYVGLEKDENKGRFGAFFARISKLRKYIKEEKPDMIVAFAKSANYRALMATAGLKFPVVVSVRNDPKRDYSSLSCRIMNKLFLERADGCVFQTEEARQFFGKRLRKHSTVILNPLNDKYLYTSVPEQHEKEIVTVGRISAQKNHKMLVRAFAGITEQFPDYVLKIYGGKASLYTNDFTGEEVEELVKELHLEDKVRFMGIRDDLETLVPTAECFVLSSNYEGMPNVLMEAMAMGLPVISTDCPCGGPAALIRQRENGILIPVGDEAALKSALTEVLSDSQLRRQMSEKALEIRNRANIQVIYEQWKQYLKL